MSQAKDNLNKYYAQALEQKKQEESLDEQLMDDVRYLSMYSIGSGGAKKVLRSRDKKTGRVLAIAQLAGSPSEAEVKAFIHEARLQAALEHPGIPTVYDIDQSDGNLPFFTMQYIQGENLGDVLRGLKNSDDYYQRHYPLMRLLEIVEDVCDIVRYAHSQGVIHFDIKPENILIAKTKKVYLCDWGIAALRSNCESDEFSDLEKMHALELKTMTMTGWIKGTPGYMSPEQAAGNTVEKSHLCDIYALGGLLYSCLTFRAPIAGDEPLEIIQKTQKGEIKSPSKRVGGSVHKGLEKVSMKALSLKPSQRYSSVDEFITQIKEFDVALVDLNIEEQKGNKGLHFVTLSAFTTGAVLLVILLYFELAVGGKDLIEPQAKPVIVETPEKKDKEKQNIQLSPKINKPVKRLEKANQVLVQETKPQLTGVEESAKDLSTQKESKEALYPLSNKVRFRRLDNISQHLFELEYSKTTTEQKEKIEAHLRKMDTDNDSEITPYEMRQMRVKRAPFIK